jgi:hypothetical protein
MATFSNNLGAQKGKNGQSVYCCEKCNYKCCKKYSWERHISTSKHIESTNVNCLATKSTNFGQNGQRYCCENCGKEYKDRTGLWRHKKKENCANIAPNIAPNIASNIASNIAPNIAPNNEDKNDKLIEYLMKENKEMKDLILEIVKNGTYNTNNTNNTNHTNSHNKAFNLNFFLNETCKNAMNITDFVDSIKLQLSDLIDVGELGYVEGISKIIVKNLNNLDETERPIHCTDKKRETMYVKDQDQWEKEDEKNSKLTRAVKRISNKNIDLLPLFREKYPEYKNSSSKISDKHDKLVIEVMETDPDKHEKIIRNISKVTTIKEN